MRVVFLFNLICVFGVGCASSDPISRFIANPPPSSKKPVLVNVAPSAPMQEVVNRALGPDARYKILESRQVRLGDGSTCIAVLVDLKGAGKKIVLLYYAGQDRGGWWADTFDAK